MSFNEEWTTIQATDYCIKVADGTHDSPKRTDSGKPLITSKHIKGKSIDFASAYLISDDDFTKINQRSKVDKWDVLISMIGEYCGYCYVEINEKVDYAVKNVGIFKTGERTKAYWLYYYLTSPIGKELLKSLRGGTSQPYISLGALRGLNIQIPTEEKKMLKIVSILSSLDDKIELNRQTNQTLESITQALFKEWFVNFNFPGATGEMQESELGEIPKGWRVESLDKVADFLNGLALQKFPPQDDNDVLPVIKIRELKNGITANSDKASKNIPAKYIVQDGDLLFSWSATLEVKFWIGGKGALNQHLFKVSSSTHPIWFCYLWTLFHLAVFRKIASDKTTTMGHIQRRHLTEAKCLIPDDIEFMNKCMIPIIEQYINLEQQTQTLEKLRDNLLPKLMNGEMSIQE